MSTDYFYGLPQDDWGDAHGEEPDNVEDSPAIDVYDAHQIRFQLLDLQLLDRATDLEFARPLGTNLYSDAPAIDDLVTGVFEAIEAHLGGISSRYRPNYQANTKMLILNLLGAYIEHPAMFVRCSMRHGGYKAKSRYNKGGISKNIITIIEVLHELGLIVDLTDGYFERPKKAGKQTRFRVGLPLARLFDDYLGMEPSSTQIRYDHEEIILKGPKPDKGVAKFMEYEDNSSTRRKRQNINRFNRRIQGHDICLSLNKAEQDLLARIFLKDKKDRFDGTEDEDLPYFNTDKNKLYRVFNEGSFQQGGRFYGLWVQSVPSKIYPFRCRLLIDEERTVELDYSNLHPHMLYTIEKKPVPAGDLYALEGVDPDMRDLVKTLVNTMLNAKSINSALKAIEKAPPEGFEGVSSYAELKRLSDKILAKHEPISRHFGSGVGRSLQYKDSRIAEGIMLDLDRLGIVCLPVHDSFIVQTRYEKKLREAMENNYRDIMHGEPPEVDRKKIKQKHRKELNQRLI